MIKCTDLRVTFGQGTALENPVLKGIDLTVPTGEFVTIIGSNGAGKSTLMNVLSGDTRVDHGSIIIDGKDVTRQGTHKRAQCVSRVFQDPMLGTCASLTLEENLALALKRGMPRGVKPALSTKKRSLFKALLSDLKIGLEERLGDPMGLLSGGQRQAVSLLMATLQPSKVLLLDEHTAALDPKMAKLVLALTQRLVVEHNLTAIMITHSMSQALELGDRTLLMCSGKIIQDLSGDKRKKLKPQDLLGFFEG